MTLPGECVNDNCSLKYRFMYVEARSPERVSIALPFGKSIHASLERQYRVMKENQRWEPFGVLLNYFGHHINLKLDQTDTRSRRAMSMRWTLSGSWLRRKCGR